MSPDRVVEHLDVVEIDLLRRQGCSPSAIARFMGRDRSTIWRELKRNMIDTPKGWTYCVSKAQEQRKAG